MKNELLIINQDLDGAGCYTVYNWFNKNVPEVFFVTQKKAEGMIKSFFERKSLADFERITVLGLDVSGFEDVLDCKNVIIITAHNKMSELKYNFKLAKAISKVDGSSCRLAFSIYKKLFPDIKPTEHQKLLILLIDDACSKTYALKQSKQLETLYWVSKSFERVFNFYENFKKGFFEFNDFQKRQIAAFQTKCENLIDSLQLYYIKLPIKNKHYSFYATFADSCFQEISDHLCNNYNADIVAVVNLEANKVYFRRSKVCDVKLNKLAKNLCDGDGYEYAASGSMTETFVNFTKLLKRHQSQI
jgi:hypothetical protein